MKTSQQLVAAAKAAIQEVSTQQLAAALSTNASTVLVDVREPAEFDRQHIPGAMNYPRGVLEMTIHKHPLVAASSTEPLLALQQLNQHALYLICHSGARSVLAAEALQRMGFSRVYSVAGGMQAWLDVGLAVKPSQEA